MTDVEKATAVHAAWDGRPQSAAGSQKMDIANASEGQDEALQVLAGYTGDHSWMEDEEKKIRRKLDWRLVPVLWLTYFLQHYDKTMLSQAAIFGLQKDLDLNVGNRYSFSASIFYIGFIVGAYPLTMLAQRFPLERVASAIVFTWGICLIFTTLCTGYKTLYVQRFFLGFLESGIGPVFMMIVGGFYKKDEQALRMNLWYSATSIASLLSPLVNWGWGQVKGRFAPWHYMYYFASALTIVWGILLWFVLPPDPVRSSGFNERERYILVARLRSNNAGVRNTQFKVAQVKELLLDLKFWNVFAIAFLSNIPNGPLSSFIPILIKGMGYTQLNSLLLKMPTGAAGFVMITGFGYLASRLKNARVYIFTCAMLITVLSSLLQWLLPGSQKGALLFAIYLMPSFSGGYAVFMGLQIANTAGYTKKTLASAGLYIGYCLGNFVGPLLFKDEYAPRYAESFTVVVATSIGSILLSWLYRFQCMYSNRRRDEEGTEESFDNAYADDYTDVTNRHFRYIL